MRVFLTWLFIISFSFAGDATIDVIKKVDSLPSLAVEDSSINSEDINRKFFKLLIADLNVISIFNVDKNHRQVGFNDTNVLVENKDMNYVLRYKLFKDDSNNLNVELKLLKDNVQVLEKKYKTNNESFYMFVSPKKSWLSLLHRLKDNYD